MDITIETIDIESSIRSLIKGITRKSNVSLIKQKERQKFEKWLRDLDIILNKIGNVKTFIIPKIKGDLPHSFSNPDHVLLAMMQPSIKNTFFEIKKHFPPGSDCGIPQKDLVFLEDSPHIALSLAWIGDTTIKYGLLLEDWKPGITTQQLHNLRESSEKNENLAGLCNRWSLYDKRIHLDPGVETSDSESMIEVKGTLTEAIFGVIFIERRMEGVREGMPLIKKWGTKEKR